MKIRAVLFDFDDTLTAAGGLDYAAIRSEIGCPQSESILGFIESIDDSITRTQASKILDRHEMDAAARTSPADGAEDLLRWLDSQDINRGILTRNTRRAVMRSLQNFGKTHPDDFDIIITRDDDVQVKPEPDGVLLAADTFGVALEELLVVGDYIYDIEAGTSAGAVTVFLASRKDRAFTPPPSDYSIDHLGKVRGIATDHR